MSSLNLQNAYTFTCVCVCMYVCARVCSGLGSFKHSLPTACGVAEAQHGLHLRSFSHMENHEVKQIFPKW
jgi:hypothetical protein